MTDVSPSQTASDLPPLPPLPRFGTEADPFWQSCREHQLRVQRCQSCGHFRFPPAAACPQCLSDASSWEQVSGSASIVSFVTYRRLYDKAYRDLLPYVVALVELDEGPRMLTRLTDVDPDTVACGQKVKVNFHYVSEECTLPLFTPV